ncbi:MAG TPA: hypothetical protein VFU69_18830 [Ktedonobacterales bacterium]|nr:hypothetical protein [Ktedonobacterales bacterium]
MKDVGNGSSEDGFEIEISAIEPGQEDESSPITWTEPEQGLSRQARARRLALAASVVLVALLVTVSVPSLRGQALSLFGGASAPTPTPGWFSYAPLTSQPSPGWMLAGPRYATSLAFAPSNPSTAYACGLKQSTGNQPVPLIVSVSHNAGRTWHTLGSPAAGGFCNLSIDPTNAQDVMLIASPDNQCASPTTSKLYRTFDGGAHWSLWSLPPVGPHQSSVLLCVQWAWVGSTLYIAPFLSGDAAFIRLAASVAGQAFDWLNPKGFFAGVHRNPAITELLATDTTLYALVGSQTDATNCCWFVQSRDAGVSWSRFTPKYQGRPVSLMGTGADGRTLLGQITYPGPPASQITELSADGGATWRALPPNPGNLIAGYLAAAPDGTLYAEFDQNFSNVSTGPQLGIYKVVPGASAWSYVGSSPGAGWFIVAWDGAGRPTALWGSVNTAQMLPAIERHRP